MTRALNVFVLAACSAVAAQTIITSPCCPEKRSVSASGSGSIDIVPDRAIVTFSVVTRNETALGAYAQNEIVSAQVLASLRAIPGVNESMIQLQGLNLNPYYEYVKNTVSWRHQFAAT